MLLGFLLTSLLRLLLLLSLLRRAALLLGSRVPWFRSMPRCLSRLCVVGAFLSPFVRSPCFYFSENSHFLEKNAALIDFIVNLIVNLSEFF